MIRRVVTTLGFVVFAAAAARAQAPAPQEQDVDFLVLHGPEGPGGLPMPPVPGAIDFMSMPVGVGGETVSGAPYSAEAVTSVVQTLADGNRIVRDSKAAVYRDGAGRTRREQGLAVIGSLVGGPEERRQVQITDPIAGVMYLLDMGSRTAHKMRAPKIKVWRSEQSSGGIETRTFDVPLPPPPGGHGAVFFRRKMMSDSKKPVIEQLGRQVIEGVEAEGTRSTLTIPAGAIGNELAITVVSERWFSPELKVLVSSRQSDPRFGETTYRLTNIVRAEPASELFRVPADFTVVAAPMPGGRAMIRREVKEIR